MTCKKCGAYQKPIIINTTELGLAKYFAWKEDPKGLCFDGWLKENL